MCLDILFDSSILNFHTFIHYGFPLLSLSWNINLKCLHSSLFSDLPLGDYVPSSATYLCVLLCAKSCKSYSLKVCISLLVLLLSCHCYFFTSTGNWGSHPLGKHCPHHQEWFLRGLLCSGTSEARSQVSV